jgi:hypothetical protein
MSRLAGFAVAALASVVSAAEPLPGPRRLAVGVELSGAMGPEDHGFFNYTSYEDSTQRLARLSLTGEWRVTDEFALLGEVRDENLHTPHVYALYARVRPWRGRDFDLQAGLIPPVFGAFARRRYGTDNPLIGYPLAYQYLTSLRTDAVPGSEGDLIVNRGSGWRVRYPLGWGNRQAEPGVPLVNSLRWDTGVQARVGAGPVEVSLAVTQGSLSNPLVSDDNGGKQVSARAGWTPVTGLVLGASAARGEYLADDVTQTLPPGTDRHSLQQAWGVDLEYSRDRWILRSEAVWSQWETPVIARTLRSLGVGAEARCKLVPGLYAAARFDHLGFSSIPGPRGPVTWDADVWRTEAGIGYMPGRRVLAKLAYQYNWRDGGRVKEEGLTTVQLVLWF